MIYLAIFLLFSIITFIVYNPKIDITDGQIILWYDLYDEREFIILYSKKD